MTSAAEDAWHHHSRTARSWCGTEQDREETEWSRAQVAAQRCCCCCCCCDACCCIAYRSHAQRLCFVPTRSRIVDPHNADAVATLHRELCLALPRVIIHGHKLAPHKRLQRRRSWHWRGRASLWDGLLVQGLCDGSNGGTTSIRRRAWMRCDAVAHSRPGCRLRWSDDDADWARNRQSVGTTLIARHGRARRQE